MEENKTKQKTNEEPTLKTLEDIDGTKEEKVEDTKTETTKEDELEKYIKQVDQLKEERDTYKAKWEKAIEVNNSLYQRLTSPKPVNESALESILKTF